MNTVLKKMMVALLALGIGQAAWADDTLNVGEMVQKEMLRMAEAGDAGAQFSLGVMYEQGKGIRQDYTEAVQWYRKAAEQGDTYAQVSLGLMYEKGQGVRQDYAKAVSWYRKAAEQGQAEAQYNLGVMYEEGQGVSKNRKVAKEWYKKACDNGLQQSCDAYRTLD